ncbi:pyridoxamine 5'-phosphate oxidase [Lindgomyces ingoldianus]|uniref:Pyridoxamine 5'-phosphate oxidase n=1 Tax=Lindgomyces ingoldianus TaxID=673940 RepID=A0ACB6R5E7_9PLEO|nr:pyridoxamine 5'-phosphate oxidase [Lindgomyces ingoldianus]KAF2473757.1 pyridoxamine 5'-phosphate oxidase [Lindgomyces ingoldianus]
MLYSAKNTVLRREPESSSTSASGISTPSNSKRIFAPTGGSDTPGKAIQYSNGTLELSDLSASPLDQFHAWFDAAKAAEVYQPETVTLATASLPDGKVSARIVFMKELDERGFVVYSNWDTSRKAADVRSNPQAALTFWWHEVERQVRVEGRVERMSDEEGQVYYDTRIRGSRIGAWASPQSQVLDGREELEKRVRDVEARFEKEEKIPIPGFWGGLRVLPEVVEFWQGRESRLHDRFRYTRVDGEEGGDGEWRIERLSP